MKRTREVWQRTRWALPAADLNKPSIDIGLASQPVNPYD